MKNLMTNLCVILCLLAFSIAIGLSAAGMITPAIIALAICFISAILGLWIGDRRY